MTSVDDKPGSDIAGLLSTERRTIAAGPAAAVFAEGAREVAPLVLLDAFDRGTDCTEGLFALAERKKAAGEKALEDYDGPLYVRKSEAELVLEAKLRT